MQKRNREFNVFSLSAIDLFCSGMGAIMVLTVILLPSHQKNAKIQDNLIIIMMTWETPEADVDLHVIDPNGNRFNYGAKNFRGVPGLLSEDSLSGPGAEVWEIEQPPPGIYRVILDLYGGTPLSGALVKGRIFHRAGLEKIPPINLMPAPRNREIGTITVDSERNVHIDF